MRPCAGKLRAILDAFLADLAAWAGGGSGPGAPCLQGFAAVAQHMLREQTSAVQVRPYWPSLPAWLWTLQSHSLDALAAQCDESSDAWRAARTSYSATQRYSGALRSIMAQGVSAAVRARRLDELLYCDSQLTAGAIQQDLAYLNILSSPDDVTILEVAMHTRGLQVPHQLPF